MNRMIDEELTNLRIDHLPGVTVPPDPLLALQLDEVRHDAFPRHRHQPRLQAEIDPGRDFIRCRVTAPQRLEDLLFALETMLDVATKKIVRVFDDRAMRRQQPLGMERT